MAAARSAIRAANLELCQCPSTGELLASLGESPTETKARISPFLNFLGGRELKELVSDEDSAALQNWVIQRLAKEMRAVKNPSIATRRDLGLIAALCAAPARGPLENCQKTASKSRSAKCFCGTQQSRNHASLSPCAPGCLERAPGQAGPAAALPQIAPMEPIRTPFPRTQRRPLEPGNPAQRFAAT